MLKEYRLRYISDITKIPPEARARFYAELPLGIKAVEDAAARAPALYDEGALGWLTRLLPRRFCERVLRNALLTADYVWVDDDKGTITLKVGDTGFTKTAPLAAFANDDGEVR